MPPPSPSHDPLAEYRRKRNFGASPEPDGSRAPQDGRRFVVQKHQARQLHYDLRLELDGVLLSWAVPKGPSVDPDVRSLAIRVEDHPVEYADFEGAIPAGAYGAGTVIVWDRGTWTPLVEPHAALEKGDLKFRLDGERLRGEWALVRTGGRGRDRDPRHWLLIKKRDAAARAGRSIVDEHATSVRSGRTLEQMARDPSRTRTPGDPAEPDVDRPPIAGARRAPLPERVRPQLAVLAARAPDGDRWLHEVKYDGYRMLARIASGDVRLVTRNGHDWTDRFPRLVEAIRAVPLREGVVDGEVVALDERGMPDFQALQGALRAEGRRPIVYYAFDLPFADGWDLSPCPLLERKALLERRLAGLAEDGLVRYSEHVAGRGPEVLREACRAGLEGIVSKRRDAPYVMRRADSWRKLKCVRADDFVVVGFTDPEGSREGLGALELAQHDAEGVLRPCGRVGTGLDASTLRELRARLDGARRPKPPLEAPPNAADGVHWVDPTMVVEVQYASRTRDGRLRHPVFRGVRPDKDPSDAMLPDVEQRPEDPPANERAASSASRRTGVVRHAVRHDAAVVVEGVPISHPERVVFPETGATKRDVAAHYALVLERLMPFLAARPLSLVRCPKGVAERCFFQRHPLAGLSDAVGGVDVPGDRRRHLLVREPRGVVELVQFGAIEFHPWGCRADGVDRPLDHPDTMVFDLDPGEGVPWSGLVEAAHAMHDFLDHLGLAAFVKTSGGKGVHVVVPIERRSSWDEVSAFCAGVARRIAAAAPRAFTASATAPRGGRIYVDHLRNRRGATSVAPYVVRARPSAGVSTPLAWEELADTTGGDMFTLATFPARLQAPRRDPWAAYRSTRQRLTRRMLAAVARDDRPGAAR